MRRSRMVFWISAFVQCALWFVFAKVSQEFIYGINHSQRPLLPILGVMAVAFVLYLICAFQVWNKTDWLKPCHVLVLAVVMRVPLVFWSKPVQEIDYYRYLWDGKTLAAGISPYQFSPADLDEIATQESGDHPASASKLIRMTERSPAVKTIFQRIDHRKVPTIYPPASQLVFAVTAFITPGLLVPRKTPGTGRGHFLLPSLPNPESGFWFREHH